MIWKSIKVIFFMTIIFFSGRNLALHVIRDQMQQLYNDPIWFILLVGIFSWSLAKFLGELNEH